MRNTSKPKIDPSRLRKVDLSELYKKLENRGENEDVTDIINAILHKGQGLNIKATQSLTIDKDSMILEQIKDPRETEQENTMNKKGKPTKRVKKPKPRY